MIKIAPEGYPFIGGALFLSLIFLLGDLKLLFILSFSVAGFLFLFFRDPERIPPSEEGIFVAPADGRIIMIKEVFEERYLKKETKLISIFMSPLDVHVNRSPSKGIVKKVLHNKGRFLAAYRDDAFLKNENVEMLLETPYGEVLVRQVAGYIARRAVCRVKEGDKLEIGERYGIIKFSSRVDLYLPFETILTVREGERVRAGESIVGRVVR